MANDGSMSTRWNSQAMASSNTYVLVKDLQDTVAKAVTFFNNEASAQTMSVNWADIGLSGSQKVRDLWAHVDVGEFADSYSISVPSHGVFAMKVSQGTGTAVNAAPRLIPENANRVTVIGRTVNMMVSSAGSITIYDLRGKRVCKLPVSPTGSVSWTAKAPGLYFVRFADATVRKIVLR
jgi:hypothetical protein